LRYGKGQTAGGEGAEAALAGIRAGRAGAGLDFMKISIKTDSKRQVVDITDQVQAELKGNGLVNVFVQHTTAAVTLADLDPGTDEDYLRALEAMTPPEKWQHPHDPSHFPDHLWSALVGQSVSVPFKNGKLELGSWQRLVLAELDGPRERSVIITVLAT